MEHCFIANLGEVIVLLTGLMVNYRLQLVRSSDRSKLKRS